MTRMKFLRGRTEIVIDGLLSKEAKLMSMQSLEQEIRQHTAMILKNPRLRNKDLLEWSTGTIEPRNGEVVVELPAMGISVAVKTEMDKRPKETA